MSAICWASISDIRDLHPMLDEEDAICLLPSGHDGEHEYVPTRRTARSRAALARGGARSGRSAMKKSKPKRKRNFFQDSTLLELATLQRTKPLKDPCDLVGAIPADTDVDAFLKEIYEARK